MEQGLLIRGALLPGENGVRGDIRVRGGTIEQTGAGLSAEGCRVLDADGLIALPGAVDSHVHFHMPDGRGGYNADDFAAGSLGALCGGTTTYIDFASPVPGRDWAEGVRLRRAEADGRTYADYALHMEVTGAFFQEIGALGALQKCGVRALKIYTTYGADRWPDARTEELFSIAAKYGYPVLAHCEDDARIQAVRASMQAEGKISARFHGQSRPADAETEAARRLIGAAEKTGCTLLIAHISAGETGLLVREARRKGLPVYGETCPHYLLLDDSLYAGDAPQRYIMTPPLRGKSDCETLWRLVESGDIGMISTDHCPFLLSDKLREPSCFDAIPGVGGAEALVSLLFTYGYQAGRLTLFELAERLSGAAARRYGLYPKKGALLPGSDADIVLLDPCAPRVLSADTQITRAGYSIYEGFRVGCTVRYVFLRGQLAARDGRAARPAFGRFVAMEEGERARGSAGRAG